MELVKTPKQSADELVERFRQFTPAEEELEYPYAIQCAIISLEETIKALNEASKYSSIIWHMEEDLKSYHEQLEYLKQQ